jgi:biotin operon repressor
VKSRTPWTTEELMQLEDLAKRNTSLQVIALKLGRSAAAVEAKAAQLKIEIRRMKRLYRRKSASSG